MTDEESRQVARIKLLGANPLHEPALVEKALQVANWREQTCTQVAMSSPRPYEDVPVHPGQRGHFCNALLALTVDELLTLHDALRACHARGLRRGEDWTKQEIRDHQPHLYGPKDTKDAMSYRRVLARRDR